MARTDNLTNFLTDVSSSIKTQKKDNTPIPASQFDTEILGIQTGHLNDTEYNEAMEDLDEILGAVKFYDYDGSIVYSYSKEDFLELNSMPTNPTHTGLTSQGWNWSLSDAKTFVTTYSKLNIGQMYTTTSGLSEFDIELNAETGLTITFKMDGTKNWGDGTSDTSTSHTYSQAGNYTISCNGTYFSTAFNNGLFGQGGSSPNYFVKNVRLATITELIGYTFYHCRSLETITLPNDLPNFNKNEVFNYCTKLKTIIIPDTVTNLSTIFQGCFALENVILPNSLITIQNSVFTNCYNLKNIIIPDNVTTIYQNIFQNCYSLKNVLLCEGITSIGNQVFSSCSALRNISIPQTVTSIGNQVFSNCWSIENVKLPSELNSLGTNIFYNCYNLKNIIIPDNITTISNYLLYQCYALQTIKIPEDITSIETYAFQNCYNVTTYDFTDSTSVPTLNTNAFDGINKTAKIIVPDSLYTDWIADSNWSTYANYIVKESES